MILPSEGPERTRILGIVNVTPDSFSDGGTFLDPDLAVEHGLLLAAQGADLVDVGGESTRPGAVRVPAEEERRRVLPVVAALADAGAAVSIDTLNASTAEAAVGAGAVLVNDVSGGLADPRMARAVAALGVPFVVTHWRGPSDRMNDLARYDDAAVEVREELFSRVDTLVAGGLDPDRIIVDPGLGFAKDAAHNWQVLSHLDEFVAQGFPVLVGASRKRFLGDLVGADAPMEHRDQPTAVISALAAAAGVWGVRVHDVAATRLALDVAAAWRSGGRPAAAPALEHATATS